MKTIGLFLLMLPMAASAQEPTTVNASGGSTTIGNLYLDYSIAEMSSVQTHILTSTILSEGYLQPYLNTTNRTPDKTNMANNFITPNGDGKNDVLFFDGLDKRPIGIRIFDRAGRLVFRASPYQNNWGGSYKGRLLEEDTYYYQLYDEQSGYSIKGFVSIVHNGKEVSK